MATWTEADIKTVWEKGTAVAGFNQDLYRKDQCGAWMKRAEYANRNSIYGWEIDHISPGGTDNLSNLRPLQWKNNVHKSDGRLKCNVTASGNKNVDNS